MAATKGTDLHGCANLLADLLDPERKGGNCISRKTPATNYKRFRRRFALPDKTKYRKPSRATAKHKVHRCIPLKEDFILDADIQRVIEVKRQLMQPPTLNHEALIDFQHPVKDTRAHDQSLTSLDAPYNTRLPTSTPERSPQSKIAGKADISLCGGGVLKGVIDDHAMNSYEYVKGINHAPKLTEGHVQFQPHPYTAAGQRFDFTQHHRDAMQNVYIDSLKASLPPEQTQYSLYSDDDPTLEKPCKDTDGLHARELRPPISPFKISQTDRQAEAQLRRQRQNEPTDRSQDLHPTRPQQSGPEDAPQTNIPTNISQLSRAQLLQAALKVALESGALDGLPAFMKPGPISPFRPGTKGFSAYDRTTDDSANAKETADEPENEESTLVEEPEMGQFHSNESGVVKQKNSTSTRDRGYQDPRLRDSVADLQIPDIPVKTKVAKKVAKSTRIDALAAPKRITKNKKTQYGSGSRKQKQDGGTKVRKVSKVAARVKPSNSKQSVGVQADTSKSSETGKNREETSNQVSQVKHKSEKPLSKKSADSVKSKTSSEVGVQANASAGEPSKKSADLVKTETKKILQEKPVLSEENLQTPDENKENMLLECDRGKKSNAGDKVTIEMAEVSDNAGPEHKIAVLDQAKYNSLFVQIKYLTKELRAVPGIKLDKEGKRLLKELDEKVNRGKLDLQTDLDIAVQPLRSENAQLRRRGRILAQQLKEKEKELQEAEKPDPNFMIVHLQMQNYNLDNEVKAQKQLICKLKEEVLIYKTELDKVNADRTELLNLVGKTEKEALAPHLTRDKDTLRAQLQAYKQTNSDLERSKDELTVRLQRASIDCRQKDQELRNMQDLVQTLQASMRNLLQDMEQDSRGPKAVTSQIKAVGGTFDRLTPIHEGSSATSAPRSHTDARTDARVVSLPESATAVHYRPPTGQERTAQAQALPSNEGHQRDFSSGYAKDDSRGKSTHSGTHGNRLPATLSEEGDRLRNAPDGHSNRQGEEERLSHIATVPVSNAGERIGMFLMDQPGLNYSKIAESLSEAAQKRISLSTNPDTDITEYRLYPGTSPIQTSAFDKLDPFIKDLLRSQRMRNQETQRQQFKSPSKSPPSIHSAATATTSVATATASVVTATESETKESTSTGPTVKELLTPLADRMQRIQSLSDTEKSRAVRAINFDGPAPRYEKPEVPPLALSGKAAEESEESYTLNIKKDLEKLQYEDSSSTLLTETSEERVAPTQNASVGEGDSRYSVTDYFKKYPDAATKTNKRMSRCDEESNDGDVSEDNHADDVIDGWGEQHQARDKKTKMADREKNERIDRWAEQVVFSPGGVPVIFDNNSDPPSPQVSPQVKLYRGTDLDTSISTINDRDSVVTSNSVTTTGSLSSVDDRIFRQGLANLDANIERVQKSLRDALI